MAKVSRTKYGTENNDDMLGTVLDDIMHGGAGNDYLASGDGNDRLFGGTGDDFLIGGNGNDFLFGGDGSDTLAGGIGNNVLAGGYGGDIFFLRAGGSGRETPPYFAANSFDTVVDYVPGVDQLNIGVSIQDLESIPLPETAFVSGYGAVAQDADDRLIYDRSTGNLYWDENGNAQGGSVLFAKLLGAPDLQFADIAFLGLPLNNP